MLQESNVSTQKKLAENLVLLLLSLEQDHDAPHPYRWLESSQNQLLEDFQ